MTQVLFMCRSLTYAQKSVKLLERSGIFGTVVKAPQELSGRGCGYAVSVRRNVSEAAAILRRSELISGKIYERTEEGDYREVRL